MVDNKGDTNATTDKVTLPNVRSNAYSLTSSSRGRSVKRSDIINQLTKDAMAEVQTARKLNNTQQSRRRGRSSDTTNKTLTRGRTTTTTTTTTNNNRNGSNNRNDGEKEMLNRGRSSRVNGPHHHRRQQGMQQQSRSSRDRSNSRRRVAVDGGKQRSSSRPRVNNNINQSLSSSSGGNGSGNRGRSVSRPRRLKDTQQKRSLSRGRRTRRDVSKESNVSRDDMSRGRLPSGGREGRHPNNNRRNSTRANEPLNNKCNNNGSSPSIPRRRFSSRSLSPHSSPNQRCGEPRSPSIERLAGRTSKSPQKPLLLEEEEEEDKHNNKKRLLNRIGSNSRSRRNHCSKSPTGGGGTQSVTSYSTRPTTIGGITDKIRTNLRSRSKSLPPGGRRRRGGIVRRRKKRSSSSSCCCSEEEERSDDKSSGEEEQERRLVRHEEEGVQRRSHSQPPRRYNNNRRSQSQPRSLFDPERRCSRSPTRPNIIRRSRRRPYQQLHRSGTPGRSIARSTRNDPFSKNGSTSEIDFYNYIRRGTSPPSRLQRSSSQSTRSSSRGRRSQRQYNDDEPTTRLRSKSPYSTPSHRGDTNGPGGNVTIMSNYTDQSRRRMSPSVAQAVKDVVSKTNESRRRESAATITSQTSRSGMVKSPAHMTSSSSTYSDESSTLGERNNDESKPSIQPLERQHSKLNTTSGQRLHLVDMSSSSSCRSDDEDGVKEEEGDDENSITPSFLESSDDETQSEVLLSRADSIEDDDNANDSMNEQIASKSVVSYKSHRSHRSAVGRRKNKTKEEQQHHQYAEDKMPIEITYIPNDDKEKKNQEQPTQVIDMTRVNTALNKIKSMERMSETVSSGGSSSQQKFSSLSKKKTTQLNKKKTKSSPQPKACKRHPPPPPPRRPPATIENAISFVNYDKTAAAVPIPVMEISQQPPIQHDTYHLYQQQQQAPPMFIQQQPERVRTEQLQVYDQQEQQLEKKSNDWMKYSTGATRRDGSDNVNDKRKSKIKGRAQSRHADRQITQHVRQMPCTDQFGDFGYYTGQVDEDGRPDGKGSMKYDNGVFYEGTWTDGCQDQKAAANYERIRGGFTSWSGKGKQASKSGMVLPWNARKNDVNDTSEKTNVRGMEWTDLNGDTGRYTGEVNNDQLPHGNGIMKYDFGLIAEGEWVNGVLKERPTDRMLGVAAAMNGGGATDGIPISSGMSIGPGANGFASGAVSILGGGGISVAPRQQIGLAHPHQPAMQQYGGGGMNMNPMLAQMANQTGAVGAQQHAIMSQQNATMKSMYGGGMVYGGTPMQMMIHPQVQQQQMIMMPQQSQQQLQTQQNNLPPPEIELEM